LRRRRFFGTTELQSLPLPSKRSSSGNETKNDKNNDDDEDEDGTQGTRFETVKSERESLSLL